MKIILSPIASNKTTTVSVDGLVITVDGIEVDLSVIPEGGQAEGEAGSSIFGTVTRDEIGIIYEYDSSLAEPNQSTDMADYTFDIISGEVPSPIVWKPVEVVPDAN